MFTETTEATYDLKIYALLIREEPKKPALPSPEERVDSESVRRRQALLLPLSALLAALVPALVEAELPVLRVVRLRAVLPLPDLDEDAVVFVVPDALAEEPADLVVPDLRVAAVLREPLVEPACLAVPVEVVDLLLEALLVPLRLAVVLRLVPAAFFFGAGLPDRRPSTLL